MASLWLHNLFAYSLQIALVTAAGAFLAGVLRLRAPSARLAWMQVLLLISLSLPALQPWARPIPPAPLAAVKAGFAAPVPRPLSVRSRPPASPFDNAVLWLVVAGIALRCLWVMAGFRTLRRYRRTASYLSTDAATGALVAISDRIDVPLTFGLRRPMVLLPAGFSAMSSGTQAAILAHELMHVRRRDWLWTLLEEFILVPLWFHPALWWLISQIRLSREQVVDAAVTRGAASRVEYVRALVEAAALRSKAGLLPAILFLRRSHLVKRVAALVKESPMSKRRSVACVLAGLAAAVVAVRLAAVWFPMEARAQNAEPIRIENGGDGLLEFGPVEFPRRAVEQHVEGVVVLQLTVDEQGFVSDAFVVSGPQPLRRAALQSALQWHYDPKRHAAGTSQAVIRFQIPPGATGERGFVLRSSNERFAFARAADASLLERDTARVKSGELTGNLRQVRLHGVAESQAVRAAVERGLPVHIGDAINQDSIRRTEQFLHTLDPRLAVWVQGDAGSSITLHVSDRVP